MGRLETRDNRLMATRIKAVEILEKEGEMPIFKLAELLNVSSFVAGSSTRDKSIFRKWIVTKNRKQTILIGLNITELEKEKKRAENNGNSLETFGMCRGFGEQNLYCDNRYNCLSFCAYNNIKSFNCESCWKKDDNAKNE